MEVQYLREVQCTWDQIMLSRIYEFRFAFCCDVLLFSHESIRSIDNSSLRCLDFDCMIET